MRYALIVLAVMLSVCIAENYRTHAMTLSVGIPGLILPELGYEYSFDENHKLGISAGMFGLVPELRLGYIHMVSSFEMMGSVGYVLGTDEPDDDPLSDIFSEVFSLGTEGCVFASATAGYRHTANNGFIFRILGGAGFFTGPDNTEVLPFAQLGIGWGL